MAAARIYRHKWLAVRLPIGLLALAAMALAWHLLLPMPPTELTLSAGRPGGVYHADAQRYAALFAQHGVDLQVLASDGSVDNLHRLRGEARPAADMAFLQGGAAALAPEGAGGVRLLTLARIGTEPVWIVARQPGIDSLQQLQGLRVSLGPKGSGTRQLATALLREVRMAPQDIVDSDAWGDALVKALREGALDAAIVVLAPGAPALHALLKLPGVNLVQLSRSTALIERMPHMQLRLLPAGSLDAAARLPARDTTVLATTASLVARADLHPALQRLAAAVAQEVHQGGGLLQRAGEFPNLRRVEFPASVQARRTLAGGLPWLEQALPFWWAQVVLRLVVICLPIGLVAWWLARLVPAYLHWLVESRLVRWYGELKYIEHDMRRGLSARETVRNIAALQDMERRMRAFQVPDDLMPRWFTLREHVEFVRNGLLRRGGA